jgi:APA family basic amino acid/polyamine antiporter
MNPRNNMPTYSAMFAAFLSFVYLSLWYCSINETFGSYIGLDEIPIVMIYGLYIFLYIWYMREFKDLGFVKRFVIPICATMGSLIILYGGITNPSIGMYLIISVAVLAFGLLFYRKEEAEVSEVA